MARFNAPVVIIAILILPSLCWGQVAGGSPVFGSLAGGAFDTVNLGNLNVNFAIPVLHKAGRGVPFTYDLSYDSSVWYPVGVSGSQTHKATGVGAELQTRLLALWDPSLSSQPAIRVSEGFTAISTTVIPQAPFTYSR